MKRSLKLFLTLFLGLCASAFCANAEKNTYTINVGEFSKLKVVNDIRVRYVCNPDSAGIVTYTCEDRFVDALLFSNKGGTLKIAIQTDYVHLWDYLPMVTVYSSNLSFAENQSKAEMRVEHPAKCGEISFKQVGNGSIVASGIDATNVKAKIATGKGEISLIGKADFANYDMVGTGKIMAEQLEAKEVSCTVFGTGSIFCWPLDKLSVKGMASTTVYYKGEPKVIKKTGVAKIERMP